MEPKRIKDNFEGPSWSNRIFFYFCLFSSILIILMIILCFFAVLNIDLALFGTSQYTAEELHNIGFYDNERYLLSALVQSLAATIALVITLSLVAVQLAAQSYSARVIDVYKRNPDMWILLCIYIITIFYGLGLTKIIGLDILGNYMEGAILVAYFMGFFAFVCLVPYMLKTLDLLKPSTVITLLTKEITKEKVLEHIQNDDDIDETDPVQPIIDIINGALERNDYETVRNGLKGISGSLINISDKNNLNGDDGTKIVDHVASHIGRFGMHAIDRQNENATFSTIISLEQVGKEAAEKNPSASRRSVDMLGFIGTKATEKRFEVASERAAKALGNVETRMIVKNEESWAVSFLREMGVEAAKQNIDNVSWETVISLKKIGLEAIQQNAKGMVNTILDAIFDIGKEAIENQLFITPPTSKTALESLAEKANKQELYDIEKYALNKANNLENELLDINKGYC
ncbi:putative integral membrane protein [Methanolobus tindarius DSM 2278]|uniref:Putative integral membrane protein n=1 Tax=Methanolobus tindarius DSM 2278 TaxID=1090322 RepID=W9DQP8_METTI|nr:DUF2254 family protein [Methanolobus tindarius]ETA67868.1 putative integral membrane protein [Methanolobus tindarius DSM 2278]